MKRIGAAVFAAALIAQPIQAQDVKDQLAAFIDANADQYAATAQHIWDLAEVGYMETESSETLQGVLRDAGFEIASGVAGMPTAFVATYGGGGPIIGIMGEYVGRIYEQSKNRPLYLVRDTTNEEAAGASK